MQGRKSLLNLKKHLHRTFLHFQIKRIELPTIVLTKFSNYNVHMLLISHHKKNYIYIFDKPKKICRKLKKVNWCELEEEEMKKKL